MVMRSILLPVLAAGVLFAATAHAEPPALTEDFFLGELPQVLSATRLRQPLSETPASVTVIDRQMIESSGALDIPAVLRLVPGFQITHVNNGNQYSVAYHGLNDAYARRMQVLIDGRSVYTASFGGVQWSEIPLALEDIERIEVIRGPNGATYGANSFAAVINIITRHAAETPGTYTRLTSGDVQTRHGLLRYGGSDGALDYRVTLAHREDEGFSAFNDRNRTTLFTYRGDYRASNRDTLETQFGYSGGPRGEGSAGSVKDPVRDEDTLNHFEQVRWRRNLATDEEISLQFYHNYYRTGDTFRAQYGATTLTSNEDLHSERYDLEFQHTRRMATDVRMVWGFAARRDLIGGEGWFGTPNLISTDLHRVFGNAEWRLTPDWVVNAGAMYEYNDITGGDVSPRLAVNYHVDRQNTVRASVSRAYRTPSLLEHQGNAVIYNDSGAIAGDGRFIVSTVQLRPERITSYELGYLGEFPSIGLLADLKIYREQIRDPIAIVADFTSAPGDSFLTFRNDGEADIDGAEAQFTLRPAPRTRIVYAHGYAHQRGRLLTIVNPPTYDQTKTATPVHTSSAFVEHNLSRAVRASVAYYRVSTMRFIGGTQEPKTDTLDARVAWRVRLGDTRGEIALIGQNLMKDYAEYDTRAILDKRYFLQLTLEHR